MTFSATNYDTLTGRGPRGRAATWQVRVVDSSPVPDSALPTDRVKTHEGEVLLCRYLPEADDLAALLRAEALLDNEIRALTRLQTRYPVPLPELPRLVGYDFDSAEPFLLLEPYRGKRLDNGLSTLMTAERHRFTVGLFRALALLAEVGLVHGSVGAASLYWDNDTTQLAHLEHAVADGEPYRSSAGHGVTATTADDVRAAGRVVFELYTGKRLAPGEVPDLTAQSEDLARLLGGVFAQRPADRPTAAEVLDRLGDRDPLPRPVNVEDLMRQGYQRFDRLRPLKAVPRQQSSAAPPAAPPQPPSARGREVPLVPLAVLVFLVLATAAVLWVVR